MEQTPVKKTRGRKKKEATIENPKEKQPPKEKKVKPEILYIKPEKYIEPGPYSVSTTTVETRIKGLLEEIDLNDLYSKIEPAEDEILMIKKDTQIKSILPEKKKRKNTIKKKVFQNQLTMVVPVEEDKNINMKLFRNGTVHITGSRTKEHVVTGMKKLMNKIVEVDNGEKKFCVEDVLKATKPKIEMFNTNFSINFHINLVKFYQILDKLFRMNDNKFIIACSYEKQIYPGIKLKLANLDEITKSYKNKHDQIRYDRKVTVLIFGSGNIIITGGNTLDQVEKAYNYVNDVLKEYFDEVVH